MKILFFTSSGAPTGLYGGSVALLNLVKGISRENYIEIGAVFPDRGLLSDNLEKLGIKCYYTYRYTLTSYPSLRNLRAIIEAPLRFGMMLFRRFRASKDLCRVIDDFHPDIIHTNVGPLDIANNVAKKRKIPHVWHIREYQDLDYNMVFFPSKKIFLKRIHHCNNHLVAITDGVYNHFNMKSTDRIIYDGVFDKKDKSTNIEKENYFLFVGSLNEAKGVKLLIETYTEYVKNGGRYELLIAGGGGPTDYRAECLDLIEKNNLKDKIHFLGFRNDVYLLMQKAKALIVPSRFEGFGFITAEAMYNSCLVIGRNTGGTKEQFDNGLKQKQREIGLRFETQKELLACLHKVDSMNINEYNKITKDAFQIANELYNNQKHVNQMLEYFNKINFNN